MMMNNVNRLLSSISVRANILVLVVIPLLALVGLGGLKVLDGWRTSTEMRDLSALAELAPEISELVHELQKERGMSAGFIGSAGKGQAAQRLASQRPETDRRLQELDRALDEFDVAIYGGSFAAKLGKARTELSRLDEERAEVSALRHTTPKMARYYTGTIGELLGVIEAMKPLSQNAEVTTAISGYLSLLTAKERAGLERAMGAAGFGKGTFSRQLHSRLVNLIGQQDAFITSFISHATSDQMSFYDQKLSGSAVSEVERLRKIAIESPFSRDLQGVTGTAWFQATTNRINLLKEIEDRLSEDLLGLAGNLREVARNKYLSVTSFLVIMTVALTMLGLIIGRNISSPISSIVEAIESYKPGDRLTMPGSDRLDELGRLARSLDIIGTTGLESARLKAALDSCQTNVMVTNRSQEIIYVNPNMQRLLTSIEGDIKKGSPQFSSSRLLGTSIDVFSKTPGDRQSMFGSLQASHNTNVSLGVHKLAIAVNPILGETGEALGAVIEWQDRTAELAALEEIDRVVAAASEGDLSRRLPLENKEGFLLGLTKGINQLTGAVDEVTGDIGALMEGLAQGDLSRKVTGDYKGRFADLKRNANDTVERLIEIVSNIQAAAEEVKNASSEISSGTDDLSHRTEQAAGNIEETAAATEEMSSTVKQNAENAKSASKLAGSANKSAKTGGTVVEKAVTAMAGIEESAQKITDIIGVIDEIAFQTNLLALNASVEAARAGEAGKGFAVVAQEVRQLAQRSAQAADDIKNLIQTSNGQVRDGVDLVNSAGEALSDIVSSIGEVTDIVQQISSASQEQSIGVQEINGSINSMDEMTQQNSALVEESSAAARALSNEASKLAELMAFFKLDSATARRQPRTVREAQLVH